MFWNEKKTIFLTYGLYEMAETNSFIKIFKSLRYFVWRKFEGMSLFLHQILLDRILLLAFFIFDL